MKCKNLYAVGIDVGSTTVKIVVLDENEKVVYKNYQRHYANIKQTMQMMLGEIVKHEGDIACTVAITGSGGLSLADCMNIEFIQEVISVTTAVKYIEPETDVVIELGGEDAKIIFLKNGPEQRMNGICAGGTGAFIDQMASLLQTDAGGLNEFAKTYKELYPIAARCGVFAKSDVQPLINDGVDKEDLAASIFQAVVNQTISGLACGRKISGRVAFLGGPLFFLSELRAAFIRTLKLEQEEIVFPENAHLLAATGAAQYSRKTEGTSLVKIMDQLKGVNGALTETCRLPPLFEDQEQYRKFRERQGRYTVNKSNLKEYKGNCYLGIDAGSTTTKLVLISENGDLLYSFYSSNMGDPIAVTKEAFKEIANQMTPEANIAYACSTGYGEHLMKDACSLDEGEVETIAHYYAAQFFEPEVDCVLDIGGQDMKCIKIKDGSVDSIIVNEACSSGCGSFIESFANSMGLSVQEFAEKAIFAQNPVELGTRCTVFMNSNVKQAQKEGAEVSDIAAGLAYSVIKNALYKVIKLKDASELGDHIVVQGGTFCNDAVLRSFEMISGCKAVRPDIAGIMGAFGAALIARERYEGQASSMLPLRELVELSYTTRTINCNGCQNNCRLTVNLFSDGRKHISGNRCEKAFSVNREETEKPPNMYEYKRHLLFNYIPLGEDRSYRGTIGIPRALNMYENYPFWAVFFKELGFRTVLSPYSDSRMFASGMESIPSESECYPAKIVHGHIEWLIAEGVKTIFYPCVFYERKEKIDSQNHFNCPMVISYPENIKNNVEALKVNNIRFLDPFIAFTNESVIGKRMCEIMYDEFGITRRETLKAVHKAWGELIHFKEEIRIEGIKNLEWMKENNVRGIVLAGRPYHLDPEVNHGIPEMIQSYGFAVFTEDSISDLYNGQSNLRVTDQWTYHSRLYAAANYVCERDDLDLIQLNSFGCGLDAVTTDQIQELLVQKGKLYTLLKIDEINNLGAARIRVRSLISALKLREKRGEKRKYTTVDFRRIEYTKEMQEKKYTILCTEMTPFHFEFIKAAMNSCGYNVVLLKNEDRNVLDMGLKYVNNDACYPAVITTGQIIDAVLSGKYDTDRLAVFMVQTGGGCRASNYIGFIRRALKSAGFEHIPVISVNANGMEANEGFGFSFKLLVKCLQGLIYGDLLMKVIYRVRPYEKIKGSANRLHRIWSEICIDDIKKPEINMKKFYQNCEQIIQEFDEFPIDEAVRKPKVGIVGEVLVKFMPFANNHLADLLESEGAEVVMPDLLEFLTYCLCNAIYREQFLGGNKKGACAAKAASFILEKIQRSIFGALDRSKRFHKSSCLSRLEANVEGILQLGNQCGEGWFLAGETIDLIKNKVNNVVCVQPFGCLPNHIVGKGIMKKVKELYSQANIVAIDYDPSASKVNQLNRIKLMLDNAKISNDTM